MDYVYILYTYGKAHTADVLHGKKCFITGAASGIGRATALAAASRGAVLYLTDIDGEGLDAVVASIRAAGGLVDAHRALDIADFDAVRSFASEIHASSGSVDIVMNVAGISIWGTGAPDEGGLGAAGSPEWFGDPIDVAPTEQWTWVAIDGTVCADGTPAGVGVNFTTQSRDLVIFFQGNGVCYDLVSCTMFQSLLGALVVDSLGATPGLTEFLDGQLNDSPTWATVQQ